MTTGDGVRFVKFFTAFKGSIHERSIDAGRMRDKEVENSKKRSDKGHAIHRHRETLPPRVPQATFPFTGE